MSGTDDSLKNVIRIPGAGLPPKRRAVSTRARVLALVLTQAAVAVVLAALFLARRPSEFEPYRFIVYYAPRPLFALPFLVLVPLTLWTRQRWLFAECLLGAGLVFGPLMDLHTNLPGSGQTTKRFEQDRIFRFMTFNIGVSEKFQIDELADYLKANDVDVLLVQEDAEIVHLIRKMKDLGWYVNSHATVFSRWPILADSPDLPHEVGGDYLYQAEVHYVRIRRGDQEFLIGSAHAPSVRANFYSFLHQFEEEQLRKVMNWQTRQIERIALSMDRSGNLPIVLGGDFNTPPRSPHVRPLEKRFLDVFAAIGIGYGYTYPAETPWLRLDRFYVSRDWVPLSCRVGPSFGSDHLPFLTELALEPGPSVDLGRTEPVGNAPSAFAAHSGIAATNKRSVPH